MFVLVDHSNLDVTSLIATNVVSIAHGVKELDTRFGQSVIAIVTRGPAAFGLIQMF